MIRNNGGRKEVNKKSKEAMKFDQLRMRIIEEKDTFFFLIHDEAHYAPTSLISSLINDKDIQNAENVLLLQV